MTALRPGTMTIGPVGLDVPLRVPESGQWRGDDLTLNGTLGYEQDYTPDESRVLREQFAGLASLSRRVLPVRFADTPELDGYYDIGDPTVSADIGAFESGAFGYQVKATRVRSSAQVMQEMRLLGAGRVNAHSFTTTRRGWYSPGVGAYGVDDGTGSVNAPTRLLRTGADGAMLVVVDNASGTSFLSNTALAARWFVAPGDHYAGGCSITRTVGGTAYRVVGEQIPAGNTGIWSIGNTLVSVSGSTTPDVAEFTMRWHDGTTWESAKTFRITKDTSWVDFDYGPIGVQILRHREDAAALRVYYGSAGKAALFTLDIWLRRGARHAEFKWTALGGELGVQAPWGVVRTTSEAAVTFTGGIAADAADADGNKYWVTSPVAVTAGTSVGRLRISSTNISYSFAIGAEMADAASGFDQVADQVNQYFGALRTSQQAVLG